MNAETGQTYALHEDFAGFVANAQSFGEQPQKVEAEKRLRRRLDADEAAALEAVRAGQAVVPISGRVAQQLAVGQRELKRRKRRAQSQARKRQRRR